MQLCGYIPQFRRPATHQVLHTCTLLCAPVSDTALCIHGPRQTHDLLCILRHMHCCNQSVYSCHIAPPLPHNLNVLALCQHVPVGLLCITPQSALPSEKCLLVASCCLSLPSPTSTQTTQIASCSLASLLLGPRAVTYVPPSAALTPAPQWQGTMSCPRGGAASSGSP